MEPPLPGIKLHPGEDKEKSASEKPEEEEEPHPDHQPEGNDNENNVVLSRSTSSSSSSSSSSSENEKDGELSVLLPEPEPDAPMWSMVSASPRGGSGLLSTSTEGFSRTPEWVMSTSSSPMNLPPLQAMGRGYDPNRIPSSIFSSKPATPMDWSVASNESLFSIHMGNNSFSRDMGLGLDDEPGSFTPNLDPVVETPRKSDVDTPRKSDVETPRKSNVYVRPGLDDDEDFNETPKMARKETGGADLNKDKMAALGPIGVCLSNSSNLSDGKAPRVSNESAKSSDSFAFPVLFGGTDGGKVGSIKTPTERSPHTLETHLQGSPKPEKTETTPPAPAAGLVSWFCCANCCPAWMRCC